MILLVNLCDDILVFVFSSIFSICFISRFVFDRSQCNKIKWIRQRTVLTDAVWKLVVAIKLDQIYCASQQDDCVCPERCDVVLTNWDNHIHEQITGRCCVMRTGIDWICWRYLKKAYVQQQVNIQTSCGLTVRIYRCKNFLLSNIYELQTY